MANKRVSELVQITAPELSIEDLLLLADITAHESKKLRLGDLNTFLQSYSNSGSFYGTASWATMAVSALSVPQQPTASYSLISGLAYNANTASHALFALSASYSLSGSYVITASYAMTSSVQLIYSSAFTEFARTASYLLYVPNVSNGTASFALTSSLTLGTASYSYTSSHALVALYALTAGGGGGGGSTVSASWASRSLQASNATQSLTASYLQYTAGVPNGTASYALVAAGYPSIRMNYGVRQAITQSTYYAQIDKVLVVSSGGGQKSSSFEAWGTAYLPMTSSMEGTGSVELIALDRWSGITQSLDKLRLSTTMPLGGGSLTGSMWMPFSLMGEVPLTGSQLVYVTASGGSRLDPSRRVRFDVTSLANDVQFSSAETMSFMAIPVSGGPPTMLYTASGVANSGTDYNIASVGNAVTEINADGLVLSSLRYVWTLPQLNYISADNNYVMSDVGGMPNSIVTMSFSQGSLRSLAPLTYTSASILIVDSNQLSTLPVLPPTMSWIDCSNNPLVRLPDPLPADLRYINANSTVIVDPPSFMPNTITTMSVASNYSLASWTTPFPSSLTYFSAYNTSITTLPTLPPGMLYLNVSSCLLTSAAIDNIAGQLVVNGLNNGTLAINGNVVSASGYSVYARNQLGVLTTRGWTITS